MSTNTHWFYVWVPASQEERKEKSRTASSVREIATALAETDKDENGPGNVIARKLSKPFVVTKIMEEEPLHEKVLSVSSSFDSTANQPNIIVNPSEGSDLKYQELGDNDSTPLIAPTLTVNEDSENDLTVGSEAFLEWESLEDIVKKVIASKNVSSVHIIHNSDNTQTQISFCVPFEDVETLLLELQNQGVGRMDNSSVSVVPASIHCSQDQGYKERENAVQEAKLDKFYSSIKSRLLVSEVIARIQSGAEFSFDFLLLLILAGMIAFMGLLENSSVILVASMLVSPLMGPILAGIFGGAIQDSKLSWSGVRHEIYALLICIFIGFFFGLLVCPWAEEYGVSQWPTQEMLSRGELRALWVGVLIAVPSGAGVALSVLGGNAGSLVGVAISASLLPPAVNAGIFWALSAVLLITGSGPDSHAIFHGFGQETDPETNLTISLYKPRYSSNLPMESFYLGLTSLALTLINILCIIVTGVLILKLKEVTPAKIPQKFAHFWRKDVRAHRNYNKKIRKGDRHGLLKDMQIGVGDGKTNQAGESVEGPILHSMFERAAADEDLINIRQWVSMPSAAMPRDPYQRSPRIVQDDPWRDSAYELLISSNRNSNAENEASKNHSTIPRQPSALLYRRNTGLAPKESYLTVNPTGTFLDVPLFLQQELQRSREIRKRLNSGLKPTDV
jgi:uncharacterized hydrophobic protein (TIGR00341 family)